MKKTRKCFYSLNKSENMKCNDTNLIDSNDKTSLIIEKLAQKKENNEYFPTENVQLKIYKTPYHLIEQLKIKLEISEKRIKELLLENENLRQINNTLLTTLSRKDDLLLNHKRENNKLNKQNLNLLLQKDNIKRANLVNKDIINFINEPNLKVSKRISNKFDLSYFDPKHQQNRNDYKNEDGPDEIIKKNGISPNSFMSFEKENERFIEDSPPLNKSKKSDNPSNLTLNSNNNSPLKRILYKSKDNARINLKLNPKNISMTEHNKTTYIQSNNELRSSKNETRLFSGESKEFYDRVKIMQDRQIHRHSFSKYRPSLLTMKEDYISKIIKSDSIREIFHITTNGDDFVKTLIKYKEEKIKLIGETINNTFRDYVSALRVIIRIKHFLSVSIKVTNSMAVEQATSMIIRNACEILECDKTSIFVYDRFCNMLSVYQGEGLEDLRIKVPINVGIIGFVFTNGQRQRIDDAYSDSRFNQEIDKKTGYKTKTILCTPLKNTNDEVIGVLEAINKNNGSFNSDDEEIIDLLGTQASLILNNSLFFDDNATFVLRMKKLIEFSILIRNINSIVEFTNESEKVLSLFWSMSLARLLIVDSDGKLYHFEKYQNIDYNGYHGLIGLVFKKKEFIGIENSNENPFYNSLVDIETSHAIITFPLMNLENKVIAIAQTSYPNNFFLQNKKPRDIDMSIIDYFSKITSTWIENYFKNLININFKD